MANIDTAFVGSVPELYTRYLGSMFLERYAADLASRLEGMVSGRRTFLVQGLGLDRDH